MVYNNKEMENAFHYMSIYYNKILNCNLSNDTFSIIKVDDSEWDRVDKTIKLKEWLIEFYKSPMYEGSSEFSEFIDKIKPDLEKPISIEYSKLINKEYHNMCMCILPVGDGYAYLFVKDLTKIG